MGGGRASCYPEDARRDGKRVNRWPWAPGSSVSENVWTLIKMCRASGRAISFPPTLPSWRAATSCAACAVCDRTQAESRLLKRPGSVTWTAAVGRHRRRLCGLRDEKSPAIPGPRMCRHFLPTAERPSDRPTAADRYTLRYARKLLRSRISRIQ